jgi:hypothetical protein
MVEGRLKDSGDLIKDPKDYVNGVPSEGANEISLWAQEHGLGEEYSTPVPDRIGDLLFEQDITDKQYALIVNETFARAPESIRMAFTKYTTSKQITIIIGDEVSKYLFESQRVLLNVSKDRLEGAVGRSYFHEYLHMVDHLSAGGKGEMTSQSAFYFHILQDEYKDYIMSYKTKHKIKDFDVVYDMIASELNNLPLKQTPSVSDLMCALSKGKIRDGWWHKGNYYSNDTVIKNESFSLLGESLFYPENYKLLKEYFPRTIRAYEDMLEGL